MGILTKAEETSLVNCIRESEKQTSGEIKVHIEKKCPSTPEKRALELFYQLGLDQTRQRNGVLIYLATQDHVFHILGDEGIHRQVPSNYWQQIAEGMQTRFQQKKLVEGLSYAIMETGKQLALLFPPEHNDTNELSDDISIG